MKDYSLIKQIKPNSRIVRFFYSLLITKRPNYKKDSDKEILIYNIKFYTGLSFFNLGNLYHSFITRLTAHYPFSLLYKDRLYHHDNIKVKKFMDNLEKIAKKAGINIFLLKGGIENEIVELIGYVDSKGKKRQKVLNDLENILQKRFENIYIRDNEDMFKLLIPTNLFRKII